MSLSVIRYRIAFQLALIEIACTFCAQNVSPLTVNRYRHRYVVVHSKVARHQSPIWYCPLFHFPFPADQFPFPTGRQAGSNNCFASGQCQKLKFIFCQFLFKV